jgi:transposase
MRKPTPRQSGAEETVRDIRRAIRRQYSAEGKIRIVLEGLCGEASIAEHAARKMLETPVLMAPTFATRCT